MKVYPTYNQDATTCMYCKQAVLPYEGYVIDTDIAGVIRHMICSHKAKELFLAEEASVEQEPVTDSLVSSVQTLRTIVCPRLDNNNQDLDAELDEMRSELLGIVGGYSESDMRGVWVSQETGRIYRDVSVKIEVIVDAAQETYLQGCLPRWATLLRQEVLLTYTTVVTASFVASSAPTYSTVPLLA